MKKIGLFLILLSFHLVTFSQDIEYARQIVEKLASPEFKGRGYIENGDKISADYISNEFRNLGLLSITRKKYFQKFDISVNTLPNSLFVRIDNTELKAGVDFLVEASCPSVHGKFQIIKMDRSGIDTEAKVASLIRNAGNSFIFIENRDKRMKDLTSAKELMTTCNF